MLVYRTFEDLKSYLSNQVSKGRSIGFVPTMGALHNGHVTLIKESIKKSDITLCSIFVNPTQFNVQADLEKYPRAEEEDIDVLKASNCNVVFIPTVEEVYPEGYKTTVVDLDGIESIMEGKQRPGHFDGVVQVVGRFFEEIDPDYSFFGEKDFQQLAVIRKMVAKRRFKVNIVSCPIVREESGLAMSSRNVRLSERGRKEAVFIWDQLQWAKENYPSLGVAKTILQIQKAFDDNEHFNLEYIEIMSEELSEIENENQKARGFLVAEIEGVRLIDNLLLN